MLMKETGLHMDRAQAEKFLDDVFESNFIKEPQIQEPSIYHEESSLLEKLDKVKVWVHASQLFKLMTGNFGLSSSQEEELENLEKRGRGEAKGKKGETLKLTPLMEAKMLELREKRDNPTIGETAKSYIDDLITHQWYGIEKYLHSKYTNHGNSCEDFSIIMLNSYLGKNYTKNEETRYRDDLILCGTPDIITRDAIIDIKNPYDTFTFDKKRNIVIEDRKHVNDKIDKEQKEYYWQGQAYMELFNKDVFYLVYTLNENYYMEGNEYSNMGFQDRIIVNKVTRDKNSIERYKQRLPVIKKVISERILKRVNSYEETILLLDELKELK